MFKYSAVIAWFFSAGSVFAAEIQEIPYPQGKTFPQVAQQAVIPFFEKDIEKPVHFEDLHFHLFKSLSPVRQKFMREVLGFKEAEFAAKLEGATMDFARDKLTFASGKSITLPNQTTPERLAISLAAYDMGHGLIIDFAPLPYKTYYGAMSRTHLRVYTKSPDGRFFDKRYDDLCTELESVTAPKFYFALIDFAIRGKFDLVETLSPGEQELVVDLVSIAIAEHRLMFKTGNPYNVDLQSKTGPFYNLAIDTLLFNHGARQLTGIEPNTKIERGNCRYYLDYFSKKEKTNEHNAQVITRALQYAYPQDIAMLAAKTKRQNFHAMIAYFMEHPEAYDEETRLSIKKIMDGFPALASKVNEKLAQEKRQ